jgi:DNA-binding transcriptional MerR regulator
LRHYEQKGLINPMRRSSSGYRYYDDETLKRLQKIKLFKQMDFSLVEIKSLLTLEKTIDHHELISMFNEQIERVDSEIDKLNQSKEQLLAQVKAAKQLATGTPLAKNQRRILMEGIQKEILERLGAKRAVTNQDLDYILRENFLYDSPEKKEFIRAIEDCLNFAKKENIKLGPIRGAAPASLSLYALGWGDFDPMESNLFPERLLAQGLELHIDVEFENGQRFVDYCKARSLELKSGRIEAFKLPILDIIDRVHERTNYQYIHSNFDDNSDEVLAPFRAGDIEKIFSFDLPKDTLLAKHVDPYYADENARKKFEQYLLNQPIYDFKDLLNIEAIYRPSNPGSFIKEYIDRYPKAKKDGFYYHELSALLNEYLKPNYGVIIYQEDILKIINEYTGWDLVTCNKFRRKILHSKLTEADRNDFLAVAPKEVLELVERESPVTFCKAHNVGAWPKLIKTTAIFKSCCQDIYFEEIAKWEKENGYSWGDFGFISNGLSLLQQ